jgi:uncharacterized protein YdcH (DUF465 family)
MKTYAEANNKDKFDWNNFLDARISEQPKGITCCDQMSPTEVKKAKQEFKKEINMAGEWVTCACGNQCNILERDNSGEPIDDELAELGSDFFYEVESLDWKSAKKTLKDIEKRSAKLINEKINNSKKTLITLGYKLVAPKAKKANNK